MATETSVMAVIRASRPSFRNPHDEVAFAAHASFLAVGYILTATGNRAFSDQTSSSSGNEEVGTEGWNEVEDGYAFVYTKTENGVKKSVTMKCTVMGDNLFIDVLPSGDELKEPLNLKIDVNDYVSDKGGHTSYGDMYKNFKGLLEQLDTEILSKLETKPKLEKANTTLRSGTTQRDEGSESSRNQPAVGSYTDPDPEPYSSRVVYPPIHPVGTGDLYPGPGAGFYPTRGGIPDGSMLVGPNDPRWFGGGGEHPGLPVRIPGVPPGARFDPYGPPGVPGFEPNHFMRNPRRPGGGTHPDLEHFQGPDYI